MIIKVKAGNSERENRNCGGKYKVIGEVFAVNETESTKCGKWKLNEMKVKAKVKVESAVEELRQK